MMKMVHEGGFHYPCAFCDFCGLQIKKGGLVVWNYETPDDLKMVHKGECDIKHNLKHGKFALSQELTDFADNLLHNVQKHQYSGDVTANGQNVPSALS